MMAFAAITSSFMLLTGIVLDGCWSYNEQFYASEESFDAFCGYNEQFHVSGIVLDEALLVVLHVLFTAANNILHTSSCSPTPPPGAGRFF